MDPLEGIPVETIRLSEKDKARLVHAVNATSTVSVGEDPSRLHVPVAQTNAVLTLSENGSAPITFVVIAYNLGRRGISLIHGRYVHPRTTCKIRFQSLSGQWHERTGYTGQCIHVQGLLHALLVVFDEPVNLDEFAHLTAEQENQHLREIAQEQPNTDNEEFSGLIGRVLFVDDQASDRKLLSHWLNRAGIQVTTVANSEAAMEHIRDNDFDLAIIDIFLNDESGNELIQTLRRTRFVQPILAVSADNQPETRENAIAAGADKFLEKPLDTHELIETCKQLMGFDETSDQSPIHSEYSSDPEMVPLLTGYARTIADKIQELRDANSKHDYDRLESLANALKGSGTSYGYPAITSSATVALLALQAEMPNMDEIRKAVNSLIQVLSRVRVNQRSNR